MTFSESVICHEKLSSGIVLRTGVDSPAFTVPLDVASAVAAGGILSEPVGMIFFQREAPLMSRSNSR